MAEYTFHLIGNAHLDPVWIWDWREGLNEGITTSKTILDLMDEDGELTFMRGEAALYEHMEENAPDVFERIRRYVEAGRWDIVGGNYVQPDTNLPATETLLRHYMHGQEYFQSRFGRRVRVAWAADSFGHSAGMPEIYAAAGFEGFAFTRPFPDALPIAKPAFWWEGPGGSRVLAYRPSFGWYGNERDEMPRRLDGLLADARQGDLRNVGVFFGLGNHGGGPSRRSLADIRAWSAQHPEVDMVFSGLHRLIDSIRAEVEEHGDDFLPTHRGELNFCLRGCYSSVGKLKYFYRKAEAQVFRAERTETAIRAAIGDVGAVREPPLRDVGAVRESPLRDVGAVREPPLRDVGAVREPPLRDVGAVHEPPLRAAWTGLLFNSFHDILPGSVIERATDDEMAWLGSSLYQAQRVENAALLALASKVDTSVKLPKGDHPAPVAVLVWNPHPSEYEGPLEIEAALDYRPIWAYRGRGDELPVELRDANGQKLPFQVIAGEGLAMPDFPWRKRVITRVKVPAMGWRILQIGWVEGAVTPATPQPAQAPRPGVIDNNIYRVSARAGDEGVQIHYRGKKLLGGVGMHPVTVEDPWGAWGAMDEAPESLNLSTLVTSWRITRVETMERGPERAQLWVRFEGGKSRLDLRISLSRQREAVDVDARLFMDERSARVKLVMPCGAGQAEFDVPGGRVTRGALGEVPGGRWVRTLAQSFDPTSARRANAKAQQVLPLGFASNALYNFDLKDGALRATIARATRYNCDRKLGPEAEPWTPAVDSGELRFKFLLSPGDDQLPVLAKQLEEPPVAMPVPPAPGELPRSGSLMQLQPETVRILALTPAAGGTGLILVAQEMNGHAVTPRLKWQGQPVKLDALDAGKIGIWRLSWQGGQWAAERMRAIP